MKIRPGFLMSLMIIVILTIGRTAYGQDAYMPESSFLEAASFSNAAKIFSGGGGDTDPGLNTKPAPNTNAKDSAAVSTSTNTNSNKIKAGKQAPTPKPTVQKQSREQDDSIMSFHFLYYMIQKYKLQDIVE